MIALPISHLEEHKEKKEKGWKGWQVTQVNGMRPGGDQAWIRRELLPTKTSPRRSASNSPHV